jgi:hypothetical protein
MRLVANDCEKKISEKTVCRSAEVDAVVAILRRRHVGGDAGGKGDVVAVVDQGVLALVELLCGVEVEFALADVKLGPLQSEGEQ